MRRQILSMAWVLLLGSLLLFAGAIKVVGVTLWDVTITLQQHRYVKKTDQTKFVYRVTSSTNPTSQAWGLELSDCVLPELIDGATSPHTWMEEPFRGLRFARTDKRQNFTVILRGRWDRGVVGVALIAVSDGQEEIVVGEIDGPYCEGSSISLDIVDGAGISFPLVSGPGTYPADQDTTMRVTSSSSGWVLSHSLGLTLPEGAWGETVARILDLTISPFETSDGTTDILVTYTLNPSEQDFAGLPQGTYAIEIAFTVSTD